MRDDIIKVLGVFNGTRKSFEQAKHNKLIRNVTDTKKLYGRLARLILYIFLFSISFIFLYPFLYMIVTSLKSSTDLKDITVNWIPRSMKFVNYVIAVTYIDYFRYLLNSVVLATFATIGHVMACSFIGYGFARYKFAGRNFLFFLVILSIIVPVQTIIIPLYMVFANLKWLNSFLPMIVPTFLGLGLKGGLFIFIFRQFYFGLPKDLEGAAKIDGCGFLKTYWSIALPVVKSAIVVVTVLSVVWHWNDFYEPSIYASLPHLAVLPAKLQSFANIVNDSLSQKLQMMMQIKNFEDFMNNGVVMAGTFLVLLPVIIFFGFMQRKFIQGIERTGMVE